MTEGKGIEELQREITELKTAHQNLELELMDLSTFATARADRRRYAERARLVQETRSPEAFRALSRDDQRRATSLGRVDDVVACLLSLDAEDFAALHAVIDRPVIDALDARAARERGLDPVYMLSLPPGRSWDRSAFEVSAAQREALVSVRMGVFVDDAQTYRNGVPYYSYAPFDFPSKNVSRTINAGVDVTEPWIVPGPRLDVVRSIDLDLDRAIVSGDVIVTERPDLQEKYWAWRAA